MKPKPLFFITFYNLNPLFGLFSSFGVWLTPSFSLKEKPIFDFGVKKHIQYLPHTFVTE